MGQVGAKVGWAADQKVEISVKLALSKVIGLARPLLAFGDSTAKGASVEAYGSCAAILATLV